MDAVAQMTPADFAYIIGAAALVMISQMLWNWRGPIADYVARWRSERTPTTANPPVAATATEPLRPIAMGRNEGNEELPRNGGNLVLRVQAQVIAHLVKSDALYLADGKGGYKPAGQVALIKLATGLAPNGRADSEYGQLRSELESLLNPQLMIAAGRPEERQIAKV
jgi:hypothetical protein